MAEIANRESGLSVRTKINQLLQAGTSLDLEGVVRNDRSAAAANGTALQAAVDYCITNGVRLRLGSGTIFTDSPIVVDGPICMEGDGTSYWQKQITGTNYAAQTQIVFTGTGDTDQTLDGVSSMKSWGGRITNPTPQSGYDDAYYELSSFITASETADGQSLTPFSAGLTIEKGAEGSIFRDFRVIPDGGGDDGMDYYQSSGAVSAALVTANWDVGIFIQAARSVRFYNVQSVGQWRKRLGLLAVPHSDGFPATLYDTKFYGCVFSGVAVRGPDHAPITATTSNTVEVPWADDHPFTAGGNTTLRLSENSRAGSTFTFTSVTRVTDGVDTGVDSLRFNGVSPDPTGKTGCMRDYRGGGTSNLSFHESRITGWAHPANVPSNNSSLAGSGVFDTPMNTVEISGNEMTEIDFSRASIEGYEQVGVYLGDCRHIRLPTYIEGNGPHGYRFIAWPHRDANAYVAGGGSATSETLTPILEPEGSTITGGFLDIRPFVQEAEPPSAYASDSGLFNPDGLISDRFAIRGGSVLFDDNYPVITGLTFSGSGQLFRIKGLSLYFELTDDEALEISFNQDIETLQMWITTNEVADNHSGAFRGKTDAAPNLTKMYGGSGLNNPTEAELTGTTGPDNFLNVTAQQGKIYVENRTGSNKQIGMKLEALG